MYYRLTSFSLAVLVMIFAGVTLSGCRNKTQLDDQGRRGSLPPTVKTKSQASVDDPLPRVSPAADDVSPLVRFRPPQEDLSGSSNTIRLEDITASSGIDFRHTDGGSGRKYIVESVVAGLALLDYDNDGYIDVYLLNGAPLAGTILDDVPRNALYRNNGDWTFTDVTAQAGVGDTGYGLGVTAGDYDNDGDDDLFVNNFGPNVLYVNNGDGTFSDATAAAGIPVDQKVGAGASFLDIEADGDLDLYIGNYVDFTYDKHSTRRIGKYEFSAGPSDYDPEPDNLLRNNGDGTFTDISQSSGVAAAAAPSMGIISFDYDDDGDVDVFICSDNAANLLFQNDGGGRFQEVGLSAGVAHDLYGNSNGSMGVDCGDFDNDGKIDLFVTNYQGELAVLYRNLGNGFFEDVSRATSVGASSYAHVKWGTTMADFDSDGDRDIFIACGHFMENIRFIDDRTDVKVPNFLLRNEGNGKFVDVSAAAGSGMDIVESSKGAAFDDLDNDGDLDVVVLNVNGPASVLRNETPAGQRSLKIRLRGTQSNRCGVGARVTIAAGNQVQTAEVHSGRGYQSHYGSELHFGLGEVTEVDQITVRWPGGATEQFNDPPPDQTLLIVQGDGIY